MIVVSDAPKDNNSDNASDILLSTLFILGLGSSCLEGFALATPACAGGGLAAVAVFVLPLLEMLLVMAIVFDWDWLVVYWLVGLVGID